MGGLDTSCFLLLACSLSSFPFFPVFYFCRLSHLFLPHKDSSDAQTTKQVGRTDEERRWFFFLFSGIQIDKILYGHTRDTR